MSYEFQLKILDRVQEHFSSRPEAVSALSDLLSLGQDAIYRRMRGDTMLTPDEMAKIAAHFDISIDTEIFGGGDKVFFSFNAFRENPDSFSRFLVDVQAQVEHTMALPGAEFYYASMEIPVFQYFYLHELIAFKLYIWGLITWDLPFLRDLPFSPDLLSPPDREHADKILDLYNRLPSTELWTLTLLENTLHQIEYISAIGKFADPQMALQLCDSLHTLINHMQEMARAGHKFTIKAGPDAAAAPFDLYHNEMLSTNNTILVLSEAGNLLYTTFANPNFMVSSDPRLCAYSENWLRTTIGKSVPIGPKSEKNRLWFFGQLRRKVDSARVRINARLQGE